MKVRRRTNGTIQTTGVSSVDAILTNYSIASADALMPLTGAVAAPRRVRAYNGSEVEVKDLSKLYVLEATADIDVEALVAELSALPEVEFAEPNYLVYISSTEERGSALAPRLERGGALAPRHTSTSFSDPLYSQQWGIPAVGADKLWDYPTVTDRRPVIAILDTGVDISHPDLAANIWQNERESAGASGVDDDANGYTDDFRGWDFVNNTNIIGDYNGHGTHCAGIAAAAGGNGIGIVGANPYALIMPVTVMQSDGTGDIATIIKGIDYATANGADVISMSFGTYTSSTALEQSLGRAYSNSYLVAAAGNDSRRISLFPCYPAAFNFVLGVVASDTSGSRASFSNYDDDGPIFTTFGEEELYNYELMAPGVSITSTYPGGKYKAFNGTSMGCPLVAGALSRLLTVKEYATKEILFGDLIHSASSVVNFDAAYALTDADRKPSVSMVSYRIEDQTDGDGRFDAGETIYFYPTLRNEWGTATNICYWLEMGENEAKVVEMSRAMADFGKPLSAYAKAESANPLVFKLKDNVVDGRHIRLVLYAQSDDMPEPVATEFTITAENGVEIGGMIDYDFVFEPGISYIITKQTIFTDSASVIFKPGSTLKFTNQSGLSFTPGTKCIAKGTKESPITFTSRDLTGSTVVYIYPACDTVEYLHIINLRHSGDVLGEVSRNCLFSNSPNSILNCFGGYYEKCNFLNQQTLSLIDNKNGNIKYCFSDWSASFANNNTNNYGKVNINTFNSNAFLSSGNYVLTTRGDIPTLPGTIWYFENPSYFGSSRIDIVKSRTSDVDNINNVSATWRFDLSNILTQPHPECHGIVWKVCVNGYDAQDEFDMLPPLGVGKHKVEVWYSKVIDTSEEPFVAMGVRPPYTQTAIGEDGSWRTETTKFVCNGDTTDVDVSVYTAYVTITGKMAIDGLNRLYVSGCHDLEYFDIPLENTRFNVEVGAAGSMSSGFMGEPGLGKVTLTWEEQDANVDDILGYNLYRYVTTESVDADGNVTYTDSDPVRINTQLIDEVEYVDYDVTPGVTYNYYYKIMRTDLAENSPSKVVAVTPLTASKGDANGSMTVDVADVVTEVSYLTGGNPQPFIFEAADVNADEVINILDIVGTINIITDPGQTGTASLGTVRWWVDEEGLVWIDTDVALAGLQLQLSGDAKYTVAEGLDGFEAVCHAGEEGETMLLAFSMSGKRLLPGEHAILRIDGDAEVSVLTFSDIRGESVVALYGEPSSLSVIEAVQMRVPSPNPFHDAVTIPFVVGRDGVHTVELLFTDMQGRTVDRRSMRCEYGDYSYTWRPAVSAGIYLVGLYVDGRLVQTAKLLKK